ncbi:hypothetical protein JIN85_20490 [Luteolibacter pohnpeiensis]|uniref:Uncharacterized protein n=1 Tax=Luteolibacter pohnpeiensis TaxID=454153 RepID=A0A934S822_9BACT|nr:hypothetical protein [Luteolibacter pohnpeiensis]MBK1884800.1 hypothetical protein [Luteolibacter pohnpeiensis]
MIPYSHVIDIPKVHPFDTEHRWTTFLGEFVLPIVQGRDLLYWFSYYGDFARFRVYTKDRSVTLDISHLIGELGLSYRIVNGEREEKNLTLEEDLGGGRFLGTERTDLKPLDRALKVLNLVHAGAELFLHSLVKDGDYWREEVNQDANQNPFGSASRSYIHLLHNLTQSPVGIVAFQSNSALHLESEYSFSYRNPQPQYQAFRVHV